MNRKEEIIVKEDMIYDDTNFMESCGNIIYQHAMDIVPDIAEIGVDSIVEDGILKEIPGINVIIAAGKCITGIAGAISTKHILVFAQKLNDGEHSYKCVMKHYEKLKKYPKKMRHEVETLVSSITNHSKYIKDQMLANFYLLYCNPDIEFTWNDFDMYNEIIRDLW